MSEPRFVSNTFSALFGRPSQAGVCLSPSNFSENVTNSSRLEMDKVEYRLMPF
mgnify:FL=1